MRKGSYHNEGYFDILIKLGNKFHGIEAKCNNFSGLLSQGAGNRVLIPSSWILYNKLPSRKSIITCKKYGVGLIIFFHNKFKFLNKAPRKPYDVMSSERFEKIKRNWRENRIGRIIHKNEIPEDYSREKIKNLEPSYDWVFKKNGVE